MPHARVNEINLYYEVHGEGEPLVLIIGHGTNITRWFRQIPALAEKYRIIAFDNRGAGRSDAPDYPYTMEIMASDIAGLLDSFNIRQAHIFGTALGSAVAQTFTLAYPDRVCSLILGAAWCGGPHTVWQNTETAKREQDRARLETLLPAERARAALAHFISQEFIDNNTEIVKQHLALAGKYPASPHGVLHQSEAIRDFDVYARLPEIKKPTLILHGSGDRIIPAENARILASRIPGAELVIFEGKGHGYYIETADDVNRTILGFLLKHHCLESNASS